MESSIAVFLLRQPACERLPTNHGNHCTKSTLKRFAVLQAKKETHAVSKRTAPRKI